MPEIDDLIESARSDLDNDAQKPMSAADWDAIAQHLIAANTVFSPNSALAHERNRLVRKCRARAQALREGRVMP